MLIKCLLGIFIWCLLGLQPTEAARSLSQRRNCPSIITFAHGRVRSKGAYFIQFVCYSPYILVGDKYASCRANKWDNPVPICVRPGCVVQPIDQGFVVPSHQDAVITVFCFPKYRLVGSPVLYCDGSRWNDTYPSCVADDASPEPALSCDFEDPQICGWKQDREHDFDWRRWNDKTPSSFLFTGPSYDHTLGKNKHGYYMYVESTSKEENDTARLISPIYEADVAKDACFQFFYHMYGRTTGGLRVYQKPVNVTVQKLIDATSNTDAKNYLLFEKWGNQGDFWYNDVLTLKDFGLDFQIVVEGVRGDSFTSDLAFDDVAILKGQNCTEAREQILTPRKEIIALDSCSDRCENTLPAPENACDCSPECVMYSNCCLDYFDFCLKPFAFPASPDYYSLPYADTTQRSETHLTRPSVPIDITITSQTSPTTAAVITRPTTRQKTTTTSPTTTTTKARTTTTRPTTKTPVVKTTQGLTTTAKTAKYENATNKEITKRVYNDTIEKARKEKDIEMRTTRASSSEKPVQANVKISTSAGYTALKSITIIAVAVLCVAMSTWAVVRWRGGRPIVIARFSSDPEVRYLTTDVDE